MAGAESRLPLGVRPLKILMITTSYLPKINGVTRTVSDLSKGLCFDGNRVTVLTRWRRGDRRSSFEECPRVLRVGTGRGSGESFLFSLFLALSAIKIARRGSLSIVHAHGTIPGIAASFVRLLTGVRFVVTFHQDALVGWETGHNRVYGTKANLTRIIQSWIARSASVVTVQSEEVGKITRNVLKLSGKNRVSVVPNPIDDKRLTSARVRNRTGIEVLYAGNLLKRKGVDVLLTAFKEVVKSFPDARLHIIGKGEYGNSLKALSNKLGIGRAVKFSGEVSDEELIDSYLKCSLFVLPSSSEVFGLVLGEALMLRTPVVAARSVGASSIIEDGESGLLVDIGNPRMLCEAITRMLSNREMAASMAQRGREFVAAKFSLQVVVRQLEGIYMEVRSKEN